MRLCLVDASDRFRSEMEERLREAGYRDIMAYGTAEACLAELASPCAVPPDIILMERVLPGLDGLAATRRIKAAPALADIPVIMVATGGDDAELAEAFAAGVVDYLQKPPRWPELLARLGSALRLKQAVDAQKAREREIQREKDRIAAILEYSHDGIAVTDAGGRFTFVSPGMERIFGLPADTYTTTDRWLDIVFPDAASRSDMADILASRPAPGHVWRRLLPFADKNGHRRTCQIHFSTMPGGDLVLNIEDVTLFEKQKEDLLKKQTRHQKDLDAAADIQQSLLPRRFSMSNAIRFAWEFTPCETIGGDIFNVFPLGPDHVGLYMLDVSGHGVASSLVALSVYNFMHYQRSTLVDRTAGRIDIVPPEAVLTRLNEEFPFSKFSKFFTILYMAINLRTGLTRYANAGHPSPIRIASDGGIAPLPHRGTIIGLEGLPPFPPGDLTLTPGDKLVLLSDGLCDTLRQDGEFFGEHRVQAVLREAADQPVAEILSSLRRHAEAFSGGTAPRDDVSLLGVEFLPARG